MARWWVENLRVWVVPSSGRAWDVVFTVEVRLQPGGRLSGKTGVL